MLVAVDDMERPVGVLTAHDLVVRALADGPNAATMLVLAVMTPHPTVIAEEAPIQSAVSVMTFGSVRRLPVVDQPAGVDRPRQLGRRHGPARRGVHHDREAANESQIPHRRPMLGTEYARPELVGRGLAIGA